jgi:hypothetical protein
MVRGMEITGAEFKERVKPYLAIPDDGNVDLDELVDTLSGAFLPESRTQTGPEKVDREKPL